MDGRWTDDTLHDSGHEGKGRHACAAPRIAETKLAPALPRGASQEGAESAGRFPLPHRYGNAKTVIVPPSSV
jgi:hypothetical protein